MECYLLPFGLTGHRSLPSGHYSLAPRLTLHAYESPSPRPAVSAGCRPSPAGYGLTQTAALERKEAPTFWHQGNVGGSFRLWQRVELGIHGLKSRGRNWSRKVRETRSSSSQTGACARRDRKQAFLSVTSSPLLGVTQPNRLISHLHASYCRRPEIGFVLLARFRLDLS